MDLHIGRDGKDIALTIDSRQVFLRDEAQKMDTILQAQAFHKAV